MVCSIFVDMVLQTHAVMSSLLTASLRLTTDLKLRESWNEACYGQPDTLSGETMFFSNLTVVKASCLQISN